MVLHVVAPERKGTYVVLKDVRLRGRNLQPGDEVDARRLDLRRGRLDALYREGFIGLPEGDQEERERQAKAIDQGREALGRPPLEDSPEEESDSEESDSEEPEGEPEEEGESELEPPPDGDEDFEE